MSRWQVSPDRLRALAADDQGAAVAASLGIAHEILPIVPGNLEAVLGARLGEGDLLINVSVEVSSRALIEWSQSHGVLYLDTCVEPWAGGYRPAPGRPLAATTNHALREAVLALRAPGKPTAIVAHGANPGVISHLARAGLLAMAADRGLVLPQGPDAWGRLSQALGIRVIQIAELDTQRPDRPQDEVFVNTWSAEGLLAEAGQAAECGWGSHERLLPAGAFRLGAGRGAGLHLAGMGACTRVSSWVPGGGEQDAWLITHHEALSLAEFLTVGGQGADDSSIAYRPTVFYAYTPCEETRRSLDRWVGSGCVEPVATRVLREELAGGEDQLGLLFVFEGGAYWYGSTVTLAEARRWSITCNATSLQVAGGILAALEWMRAHPAEGVLEAEDLPHEPLLETARPYLGRIEGIWTDWQPAGCRAAGGAGGLQFSGFLV